MKNLHILIRTSGEYDSYSTEVVGVTDDKAVSHAFLNIGDAYYGHEVEIVTLNVLDGHLNERIKNYLDPAKNPMCECGHRLHHHRRKNGMGSCKWNNSQHHDPAQRHKCKGFTLAKEQPKVFQE
jgi:hypothetical protein